MARYKPARDLSRGEIQTRLTANAAELYVAGVEFLLDGEVTSLVKGYVGEIEINDVHTEVCRYPCQQDLGGED